MFSSVVHAQTIRTFQWIGGPTYVLQLGSFKILADPMLGPKSDSAFVLKKDPLTGNPNTWFKRLTAPAPFDTAGIDLLMISHAHPDHIDKAARDRLQKDLKIILPSSNVEQVKAWGFTHLLGLDWNDTLNFTKREETLRIIAVKAMHAAEPLNTELGKVNGYIIEYRKGKEGYRIYWTGDTIWFDEIEQIKQYGKLSLLLPHLGAVGAGSALGRRGLDAAEAVRIINTLDPARTIPIHHTTFSHYREPISVLREQAAKKAKSSRITFPAAGTVYKL
jgi:L-ascorbate metabolism protein UlaG (beta-lactamase superfamily)